MKRRLLALAAVACLAAGAAQAKFTRQCPSGTMPNQTNTSCIVAAQCPAGTSNKGGKCTGAPSCPPGGNSTPYRGHGNANMPDGWCGGYQMVKGKCTGGTMPNQTNTSCLIAPQCPSGSSMSGGTCTGAPACPPGGNSTPYRGTGNANMPDGWCGGYGFVCVGPGGATRRPDAKGNCPA